jgi:hypothetical protein
MAWNFMKSKWKAGEQDIVVVSPPELNQKENTTLKHAKSMPDIRAHLANDALPEEYIGGILRFPRRSTSLICMSKHPENDILITEDNHLISLSDRNAIYSHNFREFMPKEFLDTDSVLSIISQENQVELRDDEPQDSEEDNQYFDTLTAISDNVDQVTSSSETNYDQIEEFNENPSDPNPINFSHTQISLHDQTIDFIEHHDRNDMLAPEMRVGDGQIETESAIQGQELELHASEDNSVQMTNLPIENLQPPNPRLYWKRFRKSSTNAISRKLFPIMETRTQFPHAPRKSSISGQAVQLDLDTNVSNPKNLSNESNINIKTPTDNFILNMINNMTGKSTLFDELTKMRLFNNTKFKVPNHMASTHGTVEYFE